MMKSCKLRHTAFLSNEQRVAPARSKALMESAMDVPIMNTNLVEEGTKWVLVLHLKDLLREQMELYYFYFFFIHSVGFSFFIQFLSPF